MYAVKNFNLNNDSIFKIFSYLKGSNFAKFKNNYSGQKIALYGFGEWEILGKLPLKMRN